MNFHNKFNNSTKIDDGQKARAQKAGELFLQTMTIGMNLSSVERLDLAADMVAGLVTSLPGFAETDARAYFNSALDLSIEAKLASRTEGGAAL